MHIVKGLVWFPYFNFPLECSTTHYSEGGGIKFPRIFYPPQYTVKGMGVFSVVGGAVGMGESNLPGHWDPDTDTVSV